MYLKLCDFSRTCLAVYRDVKADLLVSSQQRRETQVSLLNRSLTARQSLVALESVYT